ncbi:MAG: A/G-specific adenine glycosylase, partial [Nocardioides sp.]
MPAPASDLWAPLLEWYDEHARELPWRGAHASAWSVLVSEFMLQQTPVSRVLPVHEAWLERWPTPA